MRLATHFRILIPLFPLEGWNKETSIYKISSFSLFLCVEQFFHGPSHFSRIALPEGTSRGALQMAQNVCLRNKLHNLALQRGTAATKLSNGSGAEAQGRFLTEEQ